MTGSRWLVVAGLGLALSACAETDPYRRVGTWQPSGANDRNLAAMVANPYDLIRGRGERGSVGWEASPPIARLASGRATALPSSASQSAPSGPAAAAPGGPN